jgi:hypothetical protein
MPSIAVAVSSSKFLLEEFSIDNFWQAESHKELLHGSDLPTGKEIVCACKNARQILHAQLLHQPRAEICMDRAWTCEPSSNRPARSLR